MSWVWFLEFTSYYRKWGFSTVINSSSYIPKRIILQFWLYHYSTLTHFDYINFTYFFPSLYYILVFLESILVSCSPSLPLPLLSSFSCSLYPIPFFFLPLLRLPVFCPAASGFCPRQDGGPPGGHGAAVLGCSFAIPLPAVCLSFSVSVLLYIDWEG